MFGEPGALVLQYAEKSFLFLVPDVIQIWGLRINRRAIRLLCFGPDCSKPGGLLVPCHMHDLLYGLPQRVPVCYLYNSALEIFAVNKFAEARMTTAWFVTIN